MPQRIPLPNKMCAQARKYIPEEIPESGMLFPLHKRASGDKHPKQKKSTI
jgi:hypothetical protein